MQSSIINIGNSKEIIIPEDFLKQCGIDNEIKIEVANNTITITAIDTEKRKDWAEAFKAMSENGDDKSHVRDVFGDGEFND